MGLVAKALGRESRASSSFNMSAKDLEKFLIHGKGGDGNPTGVRVDQDSALSSTAFFQGLRILTASVGMVPLGIFRRMDRGREIMRDHPAHRVLQDPNPELTSIEFRQMVTSFAASAGNGYAEIVTENGRPSQLWPIPPTRITPDRAPNGSLRYRVRTTNGEDRILPMENVFHLRGFMRGGLLGVDTIKAMQEAVGLSVATQKFAGAFFGNGSSLSGWLKLPPNMSPEAKRNVRESLDRAHTGVTKAHRIGFLEEGMDWVQSGTPPEQSQLIETRRFSVEEVARALNVPPHLLHHLERATFNNIEELGISFVVYSLGEWYVRWEQMIAKRLILPSERTAGVYAKHNPMGLLRGDHESRANFYQTMHQLAALSSNDIRELEDLNPIEGGDRYFVRRDTIPLDSVDALVDSLTAPEPAPADDPPEPPPEDDDRTVDIREARAAKERRAVDARRQLRSDFEALFREAAESTVTKEVVAIRAALKKAFGGRDSARLMVLIDEFYDDHDEWVAERFASVILSYARRVGVEAAGEADGDMPDELDDFARSYAETFGRRWTGSSAGQLRKLIAETDPNELEDAIEARLEAWEENRAEKEAGREVVEAGEAITTFVYGAAGVSVLRWRAFGESCPLCRNMDGRTVAVTGYFLNEGDTVEGDGETAPLTTKIKLRHPPLHGGCDCAVVPG